MQETCKIIVKKCKKYVVYVHSTVFKQFKVFELTPLPQSLPIDINLGRLSIYIGYFEATRGYKHISPRCLKITYLFFSHCEVALMSQNRNNS